MAHFSSHGKRMSSLVVVGGPLDMRGCFLTAQARKKLKSTDSVHPLPLARLHPLKKKKRSLSLPPLQQQLWTKCLNTGAFGEIYNQARTFSKYTLVCHVLIASATWMNS